MRPDQKNECAVCRDQRLQTPRCPYHGTGVACAHAVSDLELWSVVTGPITWPRKKEIHNG